jgi:hypothetical protein
VNSPEHAYEVLREVETLIADGGARGVVADMEGVEVGLFELMQPQENTSAC